MADMLHRDHCQPMVRCIQNILEDLIYVVSDLGDTCGSVMPVKQMQLGEMPVERPALLLQVVERVLPIGGWVGPVAKGPP